MTLEEKVASIIKSMVEDYFMMGISQDRCNVIARKIIKELDTNSTT